MRHHKIFKQIAVILITGLLLFLLVCQMDAKSPSLDQKIKQINKGGVFLTRDFPQWKLYQYRQETLPKKYPYKYAPWISYLKIEKYMQITVINNHNAVIIDPVLYQSVQPIAEQNKKQAKIILKKLKVKGKGLKAYRKIYRYVASGKYVIGKKSTSDFFKYHYGDCVAHSSAFYVLCQVQGIPVRFCIGDASGGLHSWNLVKLKKKWWWVDTTWNYRRKLKIWKTHRIPMEMW